MTAAMNGSINFSIPDGWVPEFAKHGKNCYSIAPAPRELPEPEQDKMEANALYEILEKEVVPTYYQKSEKWYKIMRQGWKEVLPEFDSNRMVEEYYEKMY